jgi:hypothetical protein
MFAALLRDTDSNFTHHLYCHWVQILGMTARTEDIEAGLAK